MDPNTNTNDSSIHGEWDEPTTTLPNTDEGEE